MFRRFRVSPPSRLIMTATACIVALPLLLPPAIGDANHLAKTKADIEAMANAPHPRGTASHDATKLYITSAVHQAGLSVEIQKSNLPSRFASPDESLPVENLIATIPPNRVSTPTGAILLCAHYDSVPHAPGAGDNGAGVAALLAVARALPQEKHRDREIILLFSDAEEEGLIGARLFCDDFDNASKDQPQSQNPQRLSNAHPLLSRVQLIINFDARGTSGPSLMYETADHNLTLLHHFAAADPAPRGTSLARDVYRHLRNNTDFTIFRRANLIGLNFAFIGGYFNYHAPSDTPENLSDRSLSHQVEHAVALARHFTSLSAQHMDSVLDPSQSNAVFFNLSPAILIVFSQSWNTPMVALAMALAVASVLRTRHNIRPTQLAKIAARLAASLLITYIAAIGLQRCLPAPQTEWTFHAEVLAYVALSLLITLTAAKVPPDFHRAKAFTGGGTPAERSITLLLLLATLAIAATLWLPGGAYLLYLPAIALAASLLISLKHLASLLATCVVAILVLPLIYQLFVALTLYSAPLVAAITSFAIWMLIAPPIQDRTHRAT